MAPSLHDTRVLSNLIKTEKDAQASFKTWTKDAASASAALSAWSVADSGGTQDLMDVSIRISQLLSACSESQRAYIHSLSVYRASLKDVLERETALRTVIRDREILVGRLIKLGNKKPSDSALENHQAKLEDAQRELAACETFLQNEEASLSAAKRRSFREALSMRMKSMGELGRVMEESAHEAQEILSQLGQGLGYAHHDYSHDHDLEDMGSAAGDSITPSHSASQALSRASSSSSLADDLDFTLTPPSRQRLNGSTHSPRAASPVANSAPRDRQLVSHPSILRAAPAPRPIPVLAPVPAAPRPISFYATIDTGVPSFEIPKAPLNVSSRSPNGDSSDEEDERQYVAHQNGMPVAHRSSWYPHDAPPSSIGGGGRLRRRAKSDTSSIGGGERKRRGSFFGGLASLFKRKEKSSDEPSSPTKWETRTDRNVFAAQRSGGVVGGAGRVIGRTRRVDDDSDDDDIPKNVVRVVNDPKLRAKAMSDVGRVPPKLGKKKIKSAARATSDIGVVTASPMPPARMEPAPARVAPSIRTNATVIAPVGADSDSLPVKKKKKKVRDVSETVVLSATSLGMPSPAATAPPARGGLSRSNTVASAATATTAGTIKRKKKKLVADAPLPTTADLAASLPSARSSIYTTLGLPLPLPADPSHPSSPARTKVSRTPTLGADERTGTGKVPKSLGETEKRNKKDTARYSNGNWVAAPSSPPLGAPATKTIKQPKKGVVEGEESLMSVVDRVGGGVPMEERTPSRKYGAASGGGGEDDTPVIPRPLPPNAPGALTKRKSVRLADGPDSLLPPPSLSPPSSIRSYSSAMPRHGILVNHLPPPVPMTSGWDTRVSSGKGAAGEDSSDEEEGTAYMNARNAFARGTKGMQAALGGASLKGKGRAE